MKKIHSIREAVKSLKEQVKEWIKENPSGYLPYMRLKREEAPDGLTKAEKEEYEEEFNYLTNELTLFFGDLTWEQANKVQDIINEVIRRVNNCREEKDLV